MRPIKIEFQAFGPYAGYESVDFEDIGAKGIFLICGKTGIGKTMIIDAMTFALFAKSSGAGRDDFEDMRCTKADFKTPTFVRFEFEHNGEHYRFERRLEGKRTRLVASRDASRRDEDGTWKTMFENARKDEVTKKAEEIIGLDYEQFRQVIVLPQGQFEKLLTSDSNEKEQILTKIFGVDKWRKIAEKMVEEAEGRKRELSEARIRIRESLANLGCENIEDLKGKIEEKREEQRKAEEEYEKAGYAERIVILQDQLAVARRFADLHKEEKNLTRLEEKREERESWEKEEKDALRAEKARSPIEKAESASEQVMKRQREEEEACEKIVEKEELVKEAETAIGNHSEKAKEIAEIKNRKAIYEDKREGYEGLEAAVNELRIKTKGATKAADAVAHASKAMKEQAEETTRLRNEYEELNRQHSLLMDARIKGMIGELASTLVEGEPCPVCGSDVHPSVAEISAERVMEKDVDEKRAQADGKLKELNEAIERQERCAADLDEKKAIRTKAEKEVASAETALESLKKNLIEGFDSGEELDNEIDRLAETIAEYENRMKTLEEELARSKQELSKAKAKAESAASESKAALASRDEMFRKMDAALEEAGFDTPDDAAEVMKTPEELDELKRKIADHDAAVEAARKAIAQIGSELDGKEEKSEEDILEELNGAREAEKEYSASHRVRAEEIERLTAEAARLEKDNAGMEEKLREAEADVAFAKKLRGDTGTGLQRYVLGVMFSSVVAEANKLLELVHGGRYKLYRTDEGGKGLKRGLELKVHDKYSDEHDGRFVGTLSGGEKFLTALALSIGMATVAGKSGIKIEALFIDEGFGTLDEESIGDAMSILNSIQRIKGPVGIISHMQILRDNIPAKLRVVGGADGSHIISEVG